jgi:nitroimidazol reductase NimA-like FMN-containing flavoprotein (pyridoxamine 5'-phosphate oxidase superfamily)
MTIPAFFRNEIRRTDLAWDDWAAVEAFLRDQAVCRVATFDESYPYVVAQSYRFDGEAFLIHFSRNGRLARLVTANPNVTIEVDQTISLLKAPNAMNTSLEYRSVVARCKAEATLLDLEVEAQQYRALEKYRPEHDFEPIDRERGTRRIMAVRAAVVELSAKKRVLADGQYSVVGYDPGYVRYPFPAPVALSSLPPEAFAPREFPAPQQIT